MKIISADYHGSTSFDSNVDELHFFLAKMVGRGGEAVQVSLIAAERAGAWGHGGLDQAGDGAPVRGAARRCTTRR